MFESTQAVQYTYKEVGYGKYTLPGTGLALLETGGYI